MTPLQSAGAFSLHDAPRYRRPSRLWRAGAFALGAAGALGVACGGGGAKPEQGQSADQWVQTDGAAGRINLDDVQQAYRDSFNSDGFQVSKFEQRVNEIYEGDNPVLVEVQKRDNEVDVSGWEDLNGNKQLDPNEDDKLFTITQKLEENGAYETRGHGTNSYYHGSGFLTGFLPGLLIGQLFAGGRSVYVTPPPRYDEVRRERDSYRLGSGYSAQQQRNAGYGSSAQSRYGTSVSSQPVSPQRSSYQQRQVNSGGFRTSGSSTRSIGSGGKTGGASGGGLTGGGGLMRVRG